jgi:poly-gamma-glutamate synthesis protein (capsule biosynthesis protein)
LDLLLRPSDDKAPKEDAAPPQAGETADPSEPPADTDPSDADPEEADGRSTDGEGTSADIPASGGQADDEPPPEGSDSGAVPDPDGAAAQDDPGSPDQPSGEPSDRVTFAFAGDVQMSDKVADILRKEGYDYPFEQVKKWFQQADIGLVNLETPVTQGGTPAEGKQYVYKTSPEALPPMAEAGINAVNLANNHILDQGEDGLRDTLAHLNEAGILHTGAGMDEDEAYRPVMIEKRGIRVAILGSSYVVPDGSWKAGPNHPGVAESYDPARTVKAIQAAQEAADLVVVVVHWGEEGADKPIQRQIDTAYRYIDAGADLIIGGHPHVLQGFEKYKGKWIAYSLGNFIFSTNQNEKTWETIILQASCSKDGDCDLQAVPVLTKFARPVPMDEQAGGKLLERLSSLCIRAAVLPDGRVVEQ